MITGSEWCLEGATHTLRKAQHCISNHSWHGIFPARCVTHTSAHHIIISNCGSTAHPQRAEKKHKEPFKTAPLCDSTLPSSRTPPRAQAAAKGSQKLSYSQRILDAPQPRHPTLLVESAAKDTMHHCSARCSSAVSCCRQCGAGDSRCPGRES